MSFKVVLELVATAKSSYRSGDQTTMFGRETPVERFDDGQKRRWDINGPAIIGRGGTADVSLEVGSLSRRHAELIEFEGRVALRDLRSRNGTAINGQPLSEQPVVLEDGDEIVLAGAVALRFRDPLATPISPRIGRLSGVWIDPDTDAVWVDARRIEPPLTGRQLALLKLLDMAAGEVVTKNMLIQTVWADVAAEGVSDDAVAGLIKRLRQRLRETSTASELVEIVRGRGIRLIRPE